ncbi:MAG: hypothetical protein AAF195_04895, partial [Pseudomonadota bacterium]
MIILDIALIILLITALIYGFILNRRIAIFKKTKSEFGQLIKHFDKLASKTEANLAEIQNMSDQINQNIDSKLNHGKIIIDDIEYVSEKATKLVTIINNTIKETKENIRNSTKNINNS